MHDIEPPLLWNVLPINGQLMDFAMNNPAYLGGLAYVSRLKLLIFASSLYDRAKYPRPISTLLLGRPNRKVYFITSPVLTRKALHSPDLRPWPFFFESTGGNRAEIYCKYNLTPIDVGKMDMAMLEVATADVVAMAFFMLAFIAADPDTAKFIRQEIGVEANIQARRQVMSEATLDILKLEKAAPLCLRLPWDRAPGDLPIISQRVMVDM